NLSITELEYRKALETRKEIRIFLMAEDAQGLSAKLMDRGPAAERIDTFRAELEARHIISQPLFRNPDEAAKQVVTALSKIKWPPEAAEPATGGETLRGYLEWIVRTHGELTLVGLRPGSTVAVKLEEVYVALRGDRGGAYELVQSQQLLEDELEELNEAFRQLPDHERRRLRACLLRENPYMLSLSERDKPRRTSQGAIQGQVATITLADAFRDERWLVILGDPGSGKTTLGRWLALKLADTLLRGLSPESSDPQQLPNVSVPAAQVNPEMPYDRRQINLGPARLPMLVRVGEFAQELARAKVNGTPLTLMDWLCKATWNQKPPTCGQRLAPAELDRVFRDFLRRGRAVLLLDGLDEITEELGRKEVVEAIKEFCRDFVPAIDAGPVPATRIQPAAPLVVGRPCENGGNQIVVTSRIAGYHSAPLAMRSVSTVTIEPMRRSAVEHFCETWMHAVHLELHGETESAGAAAAKAAAGLKAALFDAERPGMAEIATNPLLVTNLASLFLARRDSLPRTRAELYQLAIEMLISGWRQTGLKPEEVIYVLAPLAADIHERSPTGLVEEADLTKIVTEHLAKYRGLPTDPLPPHIAVNVREFVQTLKDQVGLIAARSERLFGFLHLTFQEYLAGRHLIGNPQTAVANLLSKLGDPRWREPVLLAIGYAGWRWTANDRQLLLDSLLAADDPLGNFLPRAALLLADGVTEVPELPRSSYQKLVRRLLGAYAAPPARYQFPVLRQHLEDAFLRLRRFGQPEWMDEVLAEAIAAPKDEDLAAAAAALVRQHGWLSLPIVDALAEGLPHDSPEWGWPIEQTLRDLVSPDYPEAVPVAVPVDQAVRDALERLRRFDTGEMLRETAAEVEKLNGEAETKSKELEAQRSRLTELRDAGKNGNADDETLGDETKDVVDAINGLEKWFKVYQETTQRLKDLEAGGEEIRDKLTKAVEKERSDLEYQFFQNPRQYERNLARHAIAASARERFDLRQSLRGRADLRVADLTLRLALEHDARLVERVRQDPRQLAVLMAIYGGYPNCRADQTDAEYRHIAILLQRPDIEREHILDANPGEYVGRFGNHDTIYNMAVYLDQKMNGRVAIGKTPAEFAPTAIYRNSALDGVVLKCLAAGRPSTQWAEAFRQAWRAEPSLRGKADALTALVALGEDVTAELESALADPALHAVAEAALANLARIAEFLRDPVYRAREGIRRDLAELEEPNGWIWTDIADTVLLEMARSADVAVEFKMLTEKAPSAYQAVLRADAWYQAFCSSDDIVYSTAVVLDTVPSAEKMVALLAAAHRAPSLRAGRLPFRWVVELIPAVLVDDETDVPIEALTALDTLHLEEIRVDFEFAMQQVALTKLLPRGERNPLLRPLLATFALSIGEFQQAIELVPELGPAADPFAALVQVALRIEDPYFKSRALAALLPFLGGDSRQQIFAKAREAAALIKNPFRKTRIGELLIPLASEDERPAVLADTEAAARDIADDPDQRGRALARLARWQPTPVALTLWMDALRSLVAIADEEQRADSLQMIGQLLPKNPILADCWLWAVSTLTTKHARARANRQLGSLLLRQPPASLEAKLAANPQAWAPVLLAAAVHDTLARFQPEHSLRGLWLALLAQPANDKIVDALLKLVEDEGMPLTVEAAQAIDALLQARKPQTLELLLPLLQTPTPEVMPQVKRWQHHGNHLLSLSANLLIAEDGRKITDQTMPGLTKLLANGPDRLRLRAELVMRSRIWNAEKQTPGLKVSNL
ncbi:MAG TPA: hypothetical protein VFE22_13165, partial [Edaphobacter sp.]|nr:hypothetical protein [Edaphobacter sp.]